MRVSWTLYSLLPYSKCINNLLFHHAWNMITTEKHYTVQYWNDYLKTGDKASCFGERRFFRQELWHIRQEDVAAVTCEYLYCVLTGDADRCRDRVSHLPSSASSAARLCRLSRHRRHTEGRTRNPELIWEGPRRRPSRREWTRLLRVLLAVQCPL